MSDICTVKGMSWYYRKALSLSANSYRILPNKFPFIVSLCSIITMKEEVIKTWGTLMHFCVKAGYPKTTS